MDWTDETWPKPISVTSWRAMSLTHLADFAQEWATETDLTDMLTDGRPLVREIAVLGLKRLETPLARAVMHYVALHDASEGVRETAMELLDDV